MHEQDFGQLFGYVGRSQTQIIRALQAEPSPLARDQPRFRPVAFIEAECIAPFTLDGELWSVGGRGVISTRRYLDHVDNFKYVAIATEAPKPKSPDRKTQRQSGRKDPW
jgi:hypothetical protein